MKHITGIYPSTYGSSLYRRMAKYFIPVNEGQRQEVPNITTPDISHPEITDESRKRSLAATKANFIRSFKQAEQNIYEFLMNNAQFQELLKAPAIVAEMYDNKIKDIVSYEVKVAERLKKIKARGEEMATERGKWDRLTKVLDMVGSLNVDDWYFYIKRGGRYGSSIYRVYISQATMDRIIANGGKYKHYGYDRANYPVNHGGYYYAGQISRRENKSTSNYVGYGESEYFFGGQAKDIRCIHRVKIESQFPKIVIEEPVSVSNEGDK